MGSTRQFVARILETSAVGYAGLTASRLIDRIRKSKRQPKTEELSVAAEIQQPDLHADAVEDDAARATRLIRTLKPEQQQVIRLAVVEGHTHQSIADALQVPLGTVKTHLRRGLLRVREATQRSDVKSSGEG